MGAQTSRVPLPDHSIKWYRTPLDKEVTRQLHATSDVLGALQTVGFLANLGLFFTLALHCHYRASAPGWALFFTSMYGMQANFLINGMHELGHGKVFRTRWLNGAFLRVYSFLGWLHPDMFFSSHLRHHRYTQNAPWDLENPMPVLVTLNDFLLFGFINVKGFFEIFGQTWRTAVSKYPTGHLWWRADWEGVCYPADMPEARTPATRWAQVLLLGHATLLAWSWANGCLLVSVLVSLGPFYNGWLFFLCNSTQHIGLHHADDASVGSNPPKTVADFRLTTRTFYLNNPVVRFWYWHMNWHTEHHMYAAVPCYHLAELHDAIKHDLPPTPNGIMATWRLIIDVVGKQRVDRNYVQPITLPKPKST